MRSTKRFSIDVGSRVALALATLVGVAPAAFAQSQFLTIDFTTATQGGGVQALPLSIELTVGIALMLAVAAVVVLRRRPGRGGRLFGWVLALIAGSTLAVATGQRAISEAQAAPGVAFVNLSVSPAILDVAPFFPAEPVTIQVTNTTSQSVQITSITLDLPGQYVLAPPLLDMHHQRDLGAQRPMYDCGGI